MNRFRIALAAALPLSVLLAGCAGPGTPDLQRDTLPETLRPGPGQAHLLTLAAHGVQIYECRAAGTGAAPAWAFVAPEAELFDAGGRSAGRHGAGPSWQASDGSRIVGSLIARADAPAAGAVPWLLLGARADATGGLLARVARVQRVNTQGGTAPREGCTTTTLGSQVRVAYRADYRFFAPQ